MRLEFNPKALCYNLYCDTKVERHKMEQLLKKKLTAIDLHNIDSMYTEYGKVVTNMNKDYISIMVSGSPVIVFKNQIVSIEKRGDKATIYCSNGELYDTSNKYIDIVKQILD